MGFLLKFFGGMSLTGYIITGLLTALVTLSVYSTYLNHKVDKLKEEAAASEVAMNYAVEANRNNQQELDKAIAQLRRCVEQRDAAERSALEMQRRLFNMSREIEDRNDELASKINNEVANAPNGCDSPVPPRVTELLIEAARSANRDTNRP